MALTAAIALFAPVTAEALIEPVIPGQPAVASAQAIINVADLRDDSPPQGEREAPYLSTPMDLPVTDPETANPSTSEPPPDSDPQPDSPAAAFGFQAIGDNNTAIPPDTHGAVGPSHLMTTLNSEMRIQTRAGSVLSTFSLDSFWSSLGVTDIFDPKILYDPYGSRWMTTAMAERNSAASSVLIAASAGTDPTATWSLYRFDADSADTDWADYPSMGFNKDWIVVSVNMFANSNNAFKGTKTFTFSKASLYSGGTATATIFTLIGYGGTHVPAITHDSSLSTIYLLNNWNGDSVGSGYLRMYTITGLVGSETLSVGSFVSTPNPWASSPPSGADFAPQSGATEKVQNNDARIQNVVYRNGYLWTTHTVFLPAFSPTRSAAQWWQISTSASVVQFGRVEDTAGAKFFAFPSIAVNAHNDVLLGYSRFSASQFVSANYSFRNASTPANTMLADTVLKAGEAKYHKTYSGTRNRWGDYSNTVVDPTNDTDFWTIQEYAWTPGGGLDRWSTWWGGIVLSPAAAASPASLSFGTVGISVTSSSQTATLTNSGNGPLSISSIAIAGTHPADFVITSNTCGAKLLAGTSCAVNVAFSPTAAGSRSASLAFYTDAAGSPHTVGLSGTGVVDTAPPSSSFTTPNGSVRIYPIHSIFGISTDDISGVASVAVTYTSLIGSATTVIATLSCSTPTSCLWSAPVPILPGTYTARAKATDNSGKVESPGPTITIYVI